MKKKEMKKLRLAIAVITLLWPLAGGSRQPSAQQSIVVQPVIVISVPASVPVEKNCK